MANRPLKIISTTLLVSFLVAAGVFGHSRLMMEMPTDLGIREGHLAACPPSPNCVSSRATEEQQRVEPLTFEGEPEAAMVRLRQILTQMPRTRVVEAGGLYLRAEATSLIWRYVDDLELSVVPSDGVIHVRSASRTGTSDFGVNRRRVESLAAAYYG